MSINKVLISGNLTRDPEVRATASGTSVMTFGIAVNDRRRNMQTGEWEDVPNFVDCVIFGARAQALQRFLSKGAKVAIEGKLRYSSWERDGQRRSKLEVIVDEIEFMSRNGQAQSGSYSAQQSYSSTSPMSQENYGAPASAVPTVPIQTPPSADVFDQDIPF